MRRVLIILGALALAAGLVLAIGTPAHAATLPAPATLTVSSTTTTVTITASEIPGTTHYGFDIAREADFTQSNMKWAPTRSYTFTGLVPGHTYPIAAYGLTADKVKGAVTSGSVKTLAVAPPIVVAPEVAAAITYPVHTNIVATTFWVGEIFDASLADGSQVCSTYDSKWAQHWSGKNKGLVPSTADGCAGSPWGGCDGVSSGTTASTFKCATEKRVASNGYFPRQAGVVPVENPFYLDLPYDDLNDPIAFKNRCAQIPWAAADNVATGKNNCANGAYSYMKNRWVKITGPAGAVCYGQIEDAGPSSGALYHDNAYVFGTTNARPVNKLFSGDSSQGAGMDVSPALNGCLGFASLNGDNDHVSWQWVDRANVPAGPWLNKVTTSGVTN